MLFRMYDMDMASHAHLNALEVLSTNIFFKEFEKSKFQTRIEKMCIYDLLILWR